MTDKPLTPIAQYRKAKGLSLEKFAELVGKSKGHMHEVESTMRCTANLALAIEEATGGIIDAALLNSDIAQARQIAA